MELLVKLGQAALIVFMIFAIVAIVFMLVLACLYCCYGGGRGRGGTLPPANYYNHVSPRATPSAAGETSPKTAAAAYPKPGTK